MMYLLQFLVLLPALSVRSDPVYGGSSSDPVKAAADSDCVNGRIAYVMILYMRYGAHSDKQILPTDHNMKPR